MFVHLMPNQGLMDGMYISVQIVEIQLKKTINLRAFNEDGEHPNLCQSEVCLECLKKAIQQLEEKE